MEIQNAIDKKNLIPFALVSVLFLLWGLANSLTETLLAAFKNVMGDMSDVQASLIQFAFYGSYFCFALPAALFIQRKSYKAGVILGLLLYAGGAIMFYPAALAASYVFYLLAIYVMASGCSILETTANPYIMSMGSVETAVRRLNIAQSLNPIGSITGILVSKVFILDNISLYSISETYVGLGVILLAILVAMLFAKMPAGQDTERSTPMASFRRLWKNRRYKWGVVAQFFYVGAQTGVWAFTIRIAMKELQVNEAKAADVYLASIIAFCLARFFFTWLMKFYRPSWLMMIASAAATAACISIVLGSGGAMVTVGALVLISFCMSLMFPTIYGIALKNVGNDTKIGASGLIMSILGGALLTPAQGWVSDMWGLNMSFLVPTVCFIVILVYALEIARRQEG